MIKTHLGYPIISNRHHTSRFASTFTSTQAKHISHLHAIRSYAVSNYWLAIGHKGLCVLVLRFP